LAILSQTLKLEKTAKTIRLSGETVPEDANKTGAVIRVVMSVLVFAKRKSG
jgi:hypothetical protein